MKTDLRDYPAFALLFVALASTTGQLAAQPFTFGTQVQSTPTANITFDPATGEIQYTDASTSSEDVAYLPLTGAAAASITTSNDWTASLTVNVSARSMTTASGNSSHVVMGLVAVRGGTGKNLAFVLAAQDNNQGGDDSIYPDGWCGTAVRFGVTDSRNEVSTTPLESSVSCPDGSVYLQLSGETNASSGAVSFSNVTGVLTLAYVASTTTMTGYYNGGPVGTYSFDSSELALPFTLVVWGGSGSGVDVPAVTDMAGAFYAGPLLASAPNVTITPAGPNVVLTWPTNATGFTVQSTTNLSTGIWSTNLTVPVVVGGENVVTNSGTNAQMFYRLVQ